MNNRKVDLSTFKRIEGLILQQQGRYYNDVLESNYRHNLKNYKPEEIEQILNGTSLASQQELSKNYFEKNGFYRQIILYYATLLTYSGLLIPNPKFGNQLSTQHKKKYGAALEYLEDMNIPELLTKISLTTLVYGSYYGIIHTLDKDDGCIIIDLPIDYSRSRFKDVYGNNIVEFNVEYFNSISDESTRNEALKTYPKIISSYYRKYKDTKLKKNMTPWVILSSDIGICFSFLSDRPLFLDIIPSTIQYDEAVDTERERELEEIRKIIVQKIPHLADGQLLFEPDEAVEMHEGAVHMMKGNKNLSILTTYADVDAIISKTTADNNSTSLEKMLQNVYANAGISGQIFSPTGVQALPISIKNDISVMMILGNKYSRFISYIINTLFSNGSLKFRYSILPITEYTRSEFVTDAMKLAQSGYSFLLPAVAMGLNQLELTSIKDLENNILKLKDVLVPLSSSYTQSESSGKVGRPEKNLEDKAQKTIQNEDAINNQGGSNE